MQNPPNPSLVTSCHTGPTYVSQRPQTNWVFCKTLHMPRHLHIFIPYNQLFCSPCAVRGLADWESFRLRQLWAELLARCRGDPAWWTGRWRREVACRRAAMLKAKRRAKRGSSGSGWRRALLTPRSTKDDFEKLRVRRCRPIRLFFSNNNNNIQKFTTREREMRWSD